MIGAGGGTRPRLLELRSSRWFITLVVSVGSATDVFVYGVTVPVTPTALHTRLGFSDENVQAWTSILLALFGGALLVSSPIVGYIADRSESRRWPYLCGLVGLGAATALLCLGTSLSLWIAGRLFQGAAAATVWVVGNALLADAAGKDGVCKAMGYTAAATSVGTVAGPLLGGVVYEHFGYYAVFGLAFALIGLDIVLRSVLIERRHRIKWLGPERVPFAVEREAIQQYGTDNSAAEGPTRPPTACSGSDEQVLLRDAPSRVTLGRMGILLGSPRILVAVWGNFIISTILTSFDSVLPLFTHETFGWKQSGQGLVFLPLMIPHILSPVTGSIVDQHPRACRYMTAGAFLLFLPAMVLLGCVTDNSVQHQVLLCTLLSLIGVCIVIALPPLDAEVFRAVEEKEQETLSIFGKGGAVGLAFGLASMGFAAGSLVGPVFAGFIRLQAGWGTMSWALGLMAGATSLPTLLFMGGWISREPVRPEA